MSTQRTTPVTYEPLSSRHDIAFWILGGLFLLMFFQAAAPSPLYRVYQVHFHFSAATLTAVFAVYVLVLLVTLLFFGSVSDHLGRRPVIIVALVLSAAACAVFLAANGAVPRQVRRTFAAAVPSIVAPWALAGLYLSLGPSLAAQATGSPNLLWGGLVIFLLCGTGAAAAFVLRGISSRAAMVAGCLFLLAGTAVTCGAIATTTSAAFLAGTAVAGVGLGLAFLGAFRVITALATPGQRAGLVAAIFTVLYLAFSIPALIAGVATTTFGLRSTALVYSASLAALAVAATGILVSRPGGTPPGQPKPDVPSRHRPARSGTPERVVKR
jgi:hypothetical protein